MAKLDARYAYKSISCMISRILETVSVKNISVRENISIHFDQLARVFRQLRDLRTELQTLEQSLSWSR